MYSFDDLLRTVFNLSASALLISIVLFVLGIIIKWVFYYTIVKAGAKDAIAENASNQNAQLQAQITVMQRQLELQQEEIQRLHGLLDKQ